MSDIAVRTPPGKIQAIGIMHLIGGILNLLAGAVWLFNGVLTTIATLGLGIFVCCPAFLLIPVGIAEIMSAVKHLGKDHSTLKPPKNVAIAEIASILGCSTFSLIFGILTLVFLNDPEVEEYYASGGRLEG